MQWWVCNGGDSVSLAMSESYESSGAVVMMVERLWRLLEV